MCFITSNKNCHFSSKKRRPSKTESFVVVGFLLKSDISDIFVVVCCRKIIEIVDVFVVFYNNNKPSKSSRISRRWQNIMEMFENFARTPSSEQSCFLFLDAFSVFSPLKRKFFHFFMFHVFFFSFLLCLFSFSDAKKRKHRQDPLVKVTIFHRGHSMFGPRWKGS